MKKSLGCVVIAAGMLVGPPAPAQHNIIDSNVAEAYFFVDHYEIVIEKPPEQVWPHVLDLESWMGFIHESGPRNEVGEVFRMYEGEDFFFETTKLIPNRLLIGILHPFEIQGEESLGMGMMVLTDLDGKTLVSNFMSRHFAWHQDGPNPVRNTRESAEYLQVTQGVQNAGLMRLKEAVEND